MLKIAIKLIYRDKEYIGDYSGADSNEEEELKSLVMAIIKKETTFLKFKCQDTMYYFNEKILEESIIGIDYKEE